MIGRLNEGNCHDVKHVGNTADFHDFDDGLIRNGDGTRFHGDLNYLSE